MSEVEAVSNQYEALAVSCSQLYFALETLRDVHFLYHFSLRFFQDILAQVSCCKNRLDRSLHVRLDFCRVRIDGIVSLQYTARAHKLLAHLLRLSTCRCINNREACSFGSGRPSQRRSYLAQSKAQRRWWRLQAAR